MTPRQKAHELVTKYACLEITTLGCGLEKNPCVITNVMFTESCKQCAIIAVDEILNIYIKFKKHPQTIYWQQVKQEITNL
jgi:hypothetical protein